MSLRNNVLRNNVFCFGVTQMIKCGCAKPFCFMFFMFVLGFNKQHTCTAIRVLNTIILFLDILLSLHFQRRKGDYVLLFTVRPSVHPSVGPSVRLSVHPSISSLPSTDTLLMLESPNLLYMHDSPMHTDDGNVLEIFLHLLVLK